MKISQTYQYPGTDVDSVFALITDAAHREAAAVDQGSLSQDVTVDGTEVTIIREMESAGMPDFVKKIAGATAKIKQTENWTDDGAGGKVADIRMTVIGQPADLKGTASLLPGDGGAVFSVDGELKVSVPLIGRKIEAALGAEIIRSLDAEVAFTVAKV